MQHCCCVLQLSSAEADAQAARHAMRETHGEDRSQRLAENGAESTTVVADLSTMNVSLAAQVGTLKDELDAATQQLSQQERTAATLEAGPGGCLTSVAYAPQPLRTGCNRNGWFHCVTPRSSLTCRDQ